jgi:hypothetical protein
MDVEPFKAAAEGSMLLIVWALALTGLTVIAIAGCELLRASKHLRKTCLLFLPVWTLCGYSVSYGVQVWQGYMAALFGRKENRLKVAEAMGNDYLSQLEFLEFALFALGVWLIVFLFWWIFVDPHQRS